MSDSRKKVAILGGGAAAMTAAYYLSNTDDLRSQLEVTVYQLGWRLGGKGASGRNAELAQRVEEHGLHVWGGFYYNAFRMIHDCYDALGRDPSDPLHSWDTAFTPRPLVVWEEWLGDHWEHWPIEVPLTDEVPGRGPANPSIEADFEKLVGFIRTTIENFPSGSVRGSAHLPLTAELFGGVAHCFEALTCHPTEPGARATSPRALIAFAHECSKVWPSRGVVYAAEHFLVKHAMHALQRWLHAAMELEGDVETAIRRVFILCDLAMAMAIGILDGDLLHSGYAAIDGFDFAEWLAVNGALHSSVTSAAIRGYYDYFFAYQNGDSNRPRMSAAMGLPHLLRLVGEYKGSLFYKMNSGMGDAVFAPLYELCVRNGVRFEFFSRVTEIVPAADGQSIAEVVIGRQVDLVRAYEPLVNVKGVPSWPDAPRYEFIVPEQAARLQEQRANLEDPATNWDDTGVIRLQAGTDFDAVVLGISIGALGSICKEIVHTNRAWQTMLDNVPAIQTQAFQLWWTPDARTLGFGLGNGTGTGFAQPFESWSDMSPLLPVEDWPADNQPGTVVYFCGPMKTEPSPRGKDPAFGEQQTAAAHDAALQWTRDHAGHLYANAVDEAGRVRWDLLASLAGGSGEERFEQQYWRANYTPSERYVIDLPAASRFRLEADTSGYSNLALAGDWLFTGLGGAIEAAVLSGMQAARGLAPISDEIVGETRSPWRRPVTLKRLLEGGWDPGPTALW